LAEASTAGVILRAGRWRPGVLARCPVASGEGVGGAEATVGEVVASVYVAFVYSDI
jgi:hypothetical protein